MVQEQTGNFPRPKIQFSSVRFLAGGMRFALVSKPLTYLGLNLTNPSLTLM